MVCISEKNQEERHPTNGIIKIGGFFSVCIQQFFVSIYLWYQVSYLNLTTVSIHVLLVSNCAGQYQDSMCLKVLGLALLSSSLWLKAS